MARKKNERLLFPVLRGNMGELSKYASVLSDYLESVRDVIDGVVLSCYERYDKNLVHDNVFNELALVFKTAREKVSKTGTIEAAAKDFTQYNFDYVFRKKNRFVHENDIPVLRFRPSSRAMGILERSITENVAKIKTIPEKYLDDVQKVVFKGASKGWDLHEIRETLKDRYDITQRRADFIALSQQRLAITELDRQTSQDAGLFKTMWVHTPGLRYPRHSHRQAGAEKRIYDNREGCLIDGEHIQPGQLYGCQCNGRIVLDYD